MSQHDYDITTADANTGLTMRSAINSALQSLASNNSGSSEPGTKYPFMLWADTANDLLKQRNAANTTWITICTLSTGKVATAATADTATTATSAATAATAINATNVTNATNATNATTAEACTGNSATATTAVRSTYISAIRGLSRNLIVSASGTAATISITADEVWLCNSTHDYMVARSVNLTVSTATNGANGLDTGMKAAETWYSVWVIYNPTTSTTAGLLSLSATAPTLPDGYEFYARIGWIQTDSTTDMFPLAFAQTGQDVRYKVASGSNVTKLPIILSGASGNCDTPTWTTFSTSAFVPPTAAHIVLVAGVGANDSAKIIVAPNGSYGSQTSTDNRPPVVMNAGADTRDSACIKLMLESTNIYAASAGTTTRLQCFGWEDSL